MLIDSLRLSDGQKQGRDQLANPSLRISPENRVVWAAFATCPAPSPSASAALSSTTPCCTAGIAVVATLHHSRWSWPRRPSVKGGQLPCLRHPLLVRLDAEKHLRSHLQVADLHLVQEDVPAKNRVGFWTLDEAKTLFCIEGLDPALEAVLRATTSCRTSRVGDTPELPLWWWRSEATWPHAWPTADARVAGRSVSNTGSSPVAARAGVWWHHPIPTKLWRVGRWHRRRHLVELPVLLLVPHRRPS
mmetsp:Transcript_32778/g.76230  ORF Transcript_32778/g.76230 Transcript_32778/m.76230 type:complete len:246 (+) Transcript_32778:127-864(+)